jgi:hypothetical protein
VLNYFLPRKPPIRPPEQIATALLLLSASAQYLSENRTDEIAHTRLLGLLGAAHEHTGKSAQIQTFAAAAASNYVHYNRCQNRHQSHHLIGADSGRLAYLVRLHWTDYLREYDR